MSNLSTATSAQVAAQLAAAPALIAPLDERAWRIVVYQLVDAIAKQYGSAVAARVVAGLEDKYQAIASGAEPA